MPFSTSSLRLRSKKPMPSVCPHAAQTHATAMSVSAACRRPAAYAARHPQLPLLPRPRRLDATTSRLRRLRRPRATACSGSSSASVALTQGAGRTDVTIRCGAGHPRSDRAATAAEVGPRLPATTTSSIDEFDDKLGPYVAVSVLAGLVGHRHARACTIIWTFRMAKNLQVARPPAAGSRPAGPSPCNILGGCTLGILPYFMWRELWKGSDPESPSRRPDVEAGDRSARSSTCWSPASLAMVGASMALGVAGAVTRFSRAAPNETSPSNSTTSSDLIVAAGALHDRGRRGRVPRAGSSALDAAHAGHPRGVGAVPRPPCQGRESTRLEGRRPAATTSSAPGRRQADALAERLAHPAGGRGRRWSAARTCAASRRCNRSRSRSAPPCETDERLAEGAQLRRRAGPAVDRCPTAACCAATATSSPTRSLRWNDAACEFLSLPDWRKASVWVLDRDKAGEIVTAESWPPPDVDRR